MERDIVAADDYVAHAASALEEARGEVTRAASVFINDENARTELGAALGKAHNALSRAHRDLELHRGREQRRDDRESAEVHFARLGFGDTDQSLLEIALLPLPVEEERLSLERMRERGFDRNLTQLITRFNNEERTRTGYLMAVPGGMSAFNEADRLRFETRPQGGDSPSQQALIYPSGAFVYWQPLWRLYDPPRFFLEMIKEDLRLTILFVTRFYEEQGLVPRAVALQGQLRHVEDFHMYVPGFFEHAPKVMKPKPGVASLAFPERPMILKGTAEEMISRALPAVDAAIREHFTP